MEYSLVGSLLLCLLTVLLLRALQFISRKNHATSPKLPPGPSPLPIIGNLLDLGSKPHQSLAKLAQIHGPTITPKLGRITTIVISSSTIAKEALQTDDVILCNGPTTDAVQAHDHLRGSLAFLPVSQRWKNLRKICFSHIFSTQKLDSNQHLKEKKIKQLVSRVQESCRVGEAINVGREAFITNLNALSSTVLSIDSSDKSFDTWGFEEAVRGIVENAGKPNLVDYFLFLRKVDRQGIRWKMEVNFGTVLDLFVWVIEERVELMKGKGYVPANDMLDTLPTINESKKLHLVGLALHGLLLSSMV